MASELGAALTVKVASHSEKGKSYIVTFPVNGQPYCECKGYGYRKTCSHIKEAADKLLDQFIKQGMVPASKHEQIAQGLAIMHCMSCDEPLLGTHAFLDKCAACYRKEVFSYA